jgi:hypothetical protein
VAALVAATFVAVVDFISAVLVAISVAALVVAAFVTAAAFFSALLIRRLRFRASRVRCWYVTAGGTSVTTGGSGGTPFGTGEGVGTPEVDQWELVQRLPLGLEQPLSEVRGSPVEQSGLESPLSEVRGSPVEQSGLEPPPIGSTGKPGGTVGVGATRRKCEEARWNCWCWSWGWWW